MTDPVRLVLDTSAYARLQAGHAQVVDALAAAEVVAVPTVVLGELEAGFLLGSRAEANRRLLAAFLEEPFVEVLEVGRRTAGFYGKIFAALRRAGTPIALNDVWIAATTVACGGHLLTFDGDFRRVAELHCTVLDVPR